MRIHSFVFLFILLFSLPAVKAPAQETATYASTVTVPIIENDIAFAKNDAFLTAQRRILWQAIRDLLEPQIYKENLTKINQRQSLKPKNFLVSAKILQEHSDGEDFTMELEGAIQMRNLSKELRKMKLIFKQDPHFPITLLIEDTIELPLDPIKSRLSHFHIDVAEYNKINLLAITPFKRESKEFIEDLFGNFPNHRIIYFVESVFSENQDKFNEIKVRMFRKADFEEINSLSLKFSPSISPGSEKALKTLKQLTPNFLSLFSIQSLKRDSYEYGIESAFSVRIRGLNQPFLRSYFEQNIFRKNRRIKSFDLNKLTNDYCEYRVQSSSSVDGFVKFLEKDRPNFALVAAVNEFDTVTVDAFHDLKATVTEPELFEPDQRILDRILEARQPREMDSNEDDEIEEILNSDFIPTIREKEPNDNTRSYNRLPESTFVWGRISNRDDKDIYVLEPVKNKTELAVIDPYPKDEENEKPELWRNATLRIEWSRIGKTALSPQLRMYGGNFDFINVYHLIGSQDKLVIHHKFAQNEIPERLFIRISDKIGQLIRGETGGFKFYDYIVKYSWQTEL